MNCKRMALLLVLAATTHLAEAQPTDLASRARQVGVAVLAGAELKLLQIGMLVFGNAYGKVDIPDDRLSAAIYEAVRGHLAVEGQFQVNRVSIDRVQLADMAMKGFAASRGFLGPSLKDLSPELADFRRRCDCDALLVVTEASREVVGTNQYYRGITWRVVRPGSTELMVPLLLYLVDTATGETIAHGYSEYQSVPVSAPWPEKPGDVRALDDATWIAIGEAGSKLARTLRHAMFSVGLRPSCTMHFYEKHHTMSQRNPIYANYVAPPAMPPGADQARCMDDAP